MTSSSLEGMDHATDVYLYGLEDNNLVETERMIRYSSISVKRGATYFMNYWDFQESLYSIIKG